MDTAKDFPWIPFYMKFADALLPYRNNRQDLLGKLRKVFSPLGISLDDPYSRQSMDDIDPFTIYVQFNQNIRKTLRLSIISALKEEFAVLGDIPNSFPGLPLLYSSPFLSYRYVSFGKSGKYNEMIKEVDIEQMWQVFASALALVSQDTPENRKAFSDPFDRAHPPRNRWYLTTGLYWIRPYRFLDLNSCRGILKKHADQLTFLKRDALNIFKFKKFPTGRNYLTLCDDLIKFFSLGSSPWSSFPELSRAALAPSYSGVERVEMDNSPLTTVPLPEPSRRADAPQTPKDASYTRENFLAQTFLEPSQYDELAETLEHKKNLILQGPPGVGKTYIARLLASALAGKKDPQRVRLIQFHQNTSYEDFIMGFRPGPDGGFTLTEGIFSKFCKEAAEDRARDYFLIIDEINRGNTSKIFGDMFMLLEKDKRGADHAIPLLYNSQETFFIPENLFIIGTMNTADRSLAMLDYALRRRFAFYGLKPAFGTRKFAHYAGELNNPRLNALLKAVQELNDVIARDPALGEGFCIGHSYFSNFTPQELTPARLRSIVGHELIPLLREYWFDEPERAGEWAGKLRAALQ